MAGTISLLFLVVGWVITVRAVALRIVVRYPQAPNNYSEVILTCNDGFGDPLSAPVFKLNGVPINQMIGINVMSTGVSNQIRFNFTQEQEGVFSCEHDGFVPGNVSLAASPPATALEGDPSRRYIILPTPDSNRTIDLVCTIRPGALAERYTDRYTVRWVRSVTPEVLPFGTGSYNTTATVPVRGDRNLVAEYECEVTINHDGGSGSNSKVYSSPKTIVNITVLSTLEENAVEPQTVTVGDPVSLTCTVLRRGTNFNVVMKIRNEENILLYSCGEGGENSDRVNCDSNMINSEDGNKTESVLEITDTSGLGVGNYTVECILQQFIGQEYRDDPSFPVKNQTNSGKLIIIEDDSVIISASPSPSPSPSPTPSDSPPPNTPKQGSFTETVAGASAAGLIGIVLALVLIIIVIICCCCIEKDPDNKRCFKWKPPKSQQPECEVISLESAKDPHASPNKHFHSWGTPQYNRQDGQNEGRRTSNLDVEEGIYNGGSMASAHSGISALSEEDSSISCPSATVSSYQGEEDRFLPGDDPGYHEESIVTRPPLAMTAPSISVETAPFTPEENDFNPPYVTQQYSGSSLQERIDVEPPPRADNYGATNLLYETSQSEYGPHRYNQDPATSSLGIPSHRSGRPGSNYSVHSEPITSVHSSGRSRHHDKHHSHDNRHHRKHHSPSSQHSHSDHSASSYHSEYDVNRDHHHRSRDHHHHGNNVHGHHDHNHRRRGDKSKSRSRSRSPKVSRSEYQYKPDLMAIPTRAGQQYLSHHTLPNSGRTAIPMRASRSDDFVRSGSRGHRFHGVQEPHPPRPSDPTSQWVESTRQRHASESHPPTHLSSSNQFLPHSSSESDPDQTPPDPPKAPPQIPVGDQKIDNMLLDVVTCLVHQENCRIPRCPCREVKQRFQHLMPQMKEHMAKEAGKVVDDVQSGRFDQMDRRQQMRLSISSQNFSPDIHAHYHMTSRSHLRQSDNSRNNRFKLLQRRRSRSMDLTPVMEQPGESCATTPNVMIPDSARGLLCGPAFSPAITPAGETFRVLSPSTPSANQIAPPFLLREISLSADNLPALCLNDCPMAATPLMALGNRPLGSSSPLVTAHQQWFNENRGANQSDRGVIQSDQHKDSPSSDEGHVSDRYTSQESSSSVRTSSTNSSGKTERNSVFDDSGVNSTRAFEGQISNFSTTSSSLDESTTSRRRHNFVMNGKQRELENETSGHPKCVNYQESGYGTYGSDPESSLTRSRVPPSDLPISPNKTPQKSPAKKVVEPPPVAMVSAREQVVAGGVGGGNGTHFLPVANGNHHPQRRGSTSSDRQSVASHQSLVSQGSDGSVVTETLC